MKETTIYDRIKRRFKDAHVVRITDRLVEGIPDFYIMRDGNGFWMEVKYVKSWPVRGKVRTGLRPTQALWLETHKKHGGRAYLLVVIDKDAFAFTEGFLDIEQGLTVAEFKRRASLEDDWLTCVLGY